jgi:hypothetical protein
VKTVLLSLVLVLAVVLVACTSTQIVAAINLAANVSEAAFATYEQAKGIPTEQGDSILAYLHAGTMCTGVAAQEVATSDQAGAQVAKIAAACALGAVPALPDSQKKLKTQIAALAAAAQAIISALPQPAIVAGAGHGMFREDSGVVVVKLKKADAKKLIAAARKAQALKERIEVKRKHNASARPREPTFEAR